LPISVSSTSADGYHKMQPFTYKGETHEAVFRLMQAIEQIPRSRITGIGPDYLLAEFSNKGTKTMDDIEFMFDPGLKLIHFRSTSRKGQSDPTINMKRIEDVRRVFDSL